MSSHFHLISVKSFDQDGSAPFVVLVVRPFFNGVDFNDRFIVVVGHTIKTIQNKLDKIVKIWAFSYKTVPRKMCLDPPSLVIVDEVIFGSGHVKNDPDAEIYGAVVALLRQAGSLDCPLVRGHLNQRANCLFEGGNGRSTW